MVAPPVAAAAAGKSLGTTLKIAGAVTAGVGFLSGGLGAQSQAKAQAKIAAQQAARESALAKRESEDFRRDQSRLLAASRARRAGSGTTQAGSSLLVNEDIAFEIERGSQDILSGGAARSTRLQQEADLLRASGRGAAGAGVLRAGSSLLTAGAPLFEERGE